jgi:hypothetical protein
VLSGGRYFATEVARVLGGGAGIVLPEEGARRLVETIGDGDQPAAEVGEGARSVSAT